MKMFAYVPGGFNDARSHCANVGRLYATAADGTGGVIVSFPDGSLEAWTHLSRDSTLNVFPLALDTTLTADHFTKLSATAAYGIVATDTYRLALRKISAARNGDPFFNPDF